MSARIRLSVALVVVFATAALGFQQIGSLITYNKILVSFKTASSVQGEKPFIQARTLVDAEGIHRLIFNADGSLYFGYDFVVEAVPNTSQFLVTVRPLSQEAMEKFQAGGRGAAGVVGVAGVVGARGGGGRGAVSAEAARIVPEDNSAFMQPSLSLLPAQSPPPQRIEDGDTISIDLLANPQTGTRIFDLIKVASTHRIMMRNAAPLAEQAAALARVPDTSTIWAFGFDVIVDGKLSGTVAGGCTGKFVYFSLNSPQRFILSTQPQEGYDFRNVGVIDGNSIRFEWNGSTYELLCSEPVLEGGAKSTLWLLVDAGTDTPDAQVRARGAGGGGGGGRGVIAAGAAAGGGTGGAARVGGAGGGAGGVAAGAVVDERIQALLTTIRLRGVTCGAASNIESLVSKK